MHVCVRMYVHIYVLECIVCGRMLEYGCTYRYVCVCLCVCVCLSIHTVLYL